MKRLFLGFMVAMLAAFNAQMAVAQKQSHQDYGEMKIAECNSCHKSEGIAPNHGEDWVRSHRVTASKKDKNCGQCHKDSFCLDCHSGGGIDAPLTQETFKRDYVPKSHRSDFISLHPIKALDNPQTCYRCHDQRFCQECHDRFPKGSMRIKSHLGNGTTKSFVWNSDHASEARKNLQSCQSCHADGDVCLRCHSAKSGARVSPHPKNFKGGNISRRTDRTCRQCH